MLLRNKLLLGRTFLNFFKHHLMIWSFEPDIEKCSYLNRTLTLLGPCTCGVSRGLSCGWFKNHAKTVPEFFSVPRTFGDGFKKLRGN